VWNIESTKPDINVLFDYVTVTFPVDDEETDFYEEHEGQSIYALFSNSHFQHFLTLLGLNQLDYSDKGKIEHYDKLIMYKEHIVFKYNGPKNKMGLKTHSFELKGEGCREAEKLGIDWYQLFAYIHEYGLTVSTLHIASDIFTEKYFTIDQLLKKSLGDEYISPSRKFSHIHSSKSKVKAGTSLYFGSRDANQVNIYDKKNERYYKGYDVDTNVWIRIEIRLKSNKSWDFVRLFVLNGYENLPSLYLDILKGMLVFKSKSKTTNRKERWNIWRPWERFLKDTNGIKLKNQSFLESTLVRKREWLIHSAGRILLEFYSSINEEEKVKFFNEILDRKIEKINQTSLVRVNEHRQKFQLQTFESLDLYKEYLLKDLNKII